MQNFRNRMGWALSGALALVLIATLARAIQAGPLDPPGPVSSTMKTIGDLVPSWHQTLNSNGCGSTRWSCLMGGAAVLDNETGLVWEQQPTNTAGESWFAAQASCQSASTGNRLGWRLPAAEELLTLQDSSTLDGLPAGHPFQGFHGSGSWSSTAAPDDEHYAMRVMFPSLYGQTEALPKELAAGAWCVRGGHSENAQTSSDLNSWSKKLSAAGVDNCHTRRFTCVLANDEGVLDHETGLVWTRNMKLAAGASYLAALDVCANDVTGNARGWRLPTVAELMSLQDLSQSNPSLPVGHPFTGSALSLGIWWSSSLVPTSPSEAYSVSFTSFFAIPPLAQTEVLTTGHFVWCVRGAATQ